MDAAEKNTDLTPAIIDNIVNALGCEPGDVAGWEKLATGLTNSNYKFSVRGTPYVYRVPGADTDMFIDRECELEAMEMARKTGVDKTFILADSKKGWKISYFIEGCEYVRHDKPEDETKLMQLLKKFHSTKTRGSHDVNFEKEIKGFFSMMESHGLSGGDYVKIMESQGVMGETFESMARRSEELCAMDRQIREDGFESVLCHNDIYWPNLLKAPNGDIAIIDWEYCGNNYPGCDVANYAASEGLNLCEYVDLCEAYEGRPLNPLMYRYYLACLGIRAWYWTVWAVYEESVGTRVDELKSWHGTALMALKAARPLF